MVALVPSAGTSKVVSTSFQSKVPSPERRVWLINWGLSPLTWRNHPELPTTFSPRTQPLSS